MSKKSKNQKKPGLERGSGRIESQKGSQKAPVQKEPAGMTNFVLVFLMILPFAFSRTNIDPVLALRFTLTAAFVGLFVIYFFLIRKRLLNQSLPMVVKLIFIAGIAYGIWNFVGLTQAVNKQLTYYGLARHFLNMIVLFMITNMAEQEENRLINVFKMICIVAIAHTIIGVGQFYDAAFTDLPGNFRPYSLMANRNLYGSAQVMLLPFCIYVLYKSNFAWRIISSLAIVGVLISSIISQTRSSWLEGLTIIFASLLLVMIFSRENRKKWLIGTLIGFGIILLISFLLIKSDTEGEFSQSIKQRTSEVFSSGKDTTAAAENVSERIKIWKKTLQVIKDKPITGVGMENWKAVVPKYGTEGLLWEKGFYIPDSTHNDYLLVAAESGIPGALLYFGMWGLIVFAGFKTLVKTTSTDRKILVILLLAALAGFSVDAMFSFPLQRMEHTFYLLLSGGILTGLYFKTYAEEQKRKKLHPAFSVAFILIAGFDVLWGFTRMNFEKHMGRSKFLEEQKNYQLSIEEGNKARNSLTNIPPNGFPVEAYIGLSQKELKNYPEAIKEMNKSIKISPYNKAMYVNMGTVYTDLKKYDSAIIYYNKGLALAPKMDIIFFNLAVNYFQMKDYKKCLEMLSKADISKETSLLSMKRDAETLLAKEQTPGNK